MILHFSDSLGILLHIFPQGDLLFGVFILSCIFKVKKKVIIIFNVSNMADLLIANGHRRSSAFYKLGITLKRRHSIILN